MIDGPSRALAPALLGGALCLALGVGCGRAPRGEQGAIRAWLVVHVDPLAREGGEGCERSDLFECGRPLAGPWDQRTQNLAWLLGEWEATGRTVDVQVGPEAALAWAEDPVLVEALVADYQVNGDHEGAVLAEAEARARLAERSAQAREALADALASGTASLGSHVHTVLPDAVEGVWGTAPKAGGGPGPCEAWSGDPQTEGSSAISEEVAAYGAGSAAELAALLDTELRSFTGHLPRSMAAKATLLDDPEGLDPDSGAAFPEAFRPTDLGSAYSECLLQAVDHPPFEVYPADAHAALARGSGPLVVPGERVVGSMAEHLDAPSDGSLGAVRRRILQLLLNWRYEGLMGGPERPWTWTFHTHLYQLYPGSVARRDPTGREASTRDGVPLREDLLGVGSFLDEFAGLASWQDVAGAEGAVVEWGLPEDLEGLELSEEEGLFDYGGGGAPPEGLDAEHYPYLPLVAEVLAQTHLRCTGRLKRVELFGLEHCEAGWAWGGEDTPGYHCADGAAATWRYVLVPEEEACLRTDTSGLQGAALDAGSLGSVPSCRKGLSVPEAGLLVVPSDGLPRWEGSCEALEEDSG